MNMVANFVGTPVHVAPKVQSLYDHKQLKLVRANCPKDLTESEFDQFVRNARIIGLDPLRGQIYAFLFNKNDAEKRRVVVVIGISGYRAVAKRSGDYAADPDEPKFLRRTKEKNALSNPEGLVKATVYVKQFIHGEWHRIAGVAKWTEYAPIKDGKIDKTSAWWKSPELMLAKCAEAQALRKGWPDIFSDVYEEAETDRSKVLDLSPSEFLRTGDEPAMASPSGMRSGRPTLDIDWLEGGQLASVEVREVGRRVNEFIDHYEVSNPLIILSFRDVNRIALREFWRHEKGEALALGDRFDEIETRIRAIQCANKVEPRRKVRKE